jgi:uncharacterized membrane protein
MHDNGMAGQASCLGGKASMNYTVRRLLIVKLPSAVAIALLFAWLLLISQDVFPEAGAFNAISDAGAILEPDNSGEGYPGTYITYTHTLTNSSASSDTYTLIVSSSAGFIVSVTPFTQALGVDESAPVTVTVAIPEDAPAGLEDLSVVTATSNNPAISATATNTTTVLQVWAVEIEPAAHSSNADAGSQVHYEHTITNSGNGFDTFAIAADSDQGYEVSLSEESVPLVAGSTAFITATITIPPDAEGGNVDETTLRVMSSNWPTATAAIAVNTTTVNNQYGVVIAPDNSGNADPGQSITYTHTLTNTGNREDNFMLSAVSSEGFETDLWPTSVTLAKNTTSTVEVTVTVPVTALAGIDTTVVTAVSNGGDNVADSAVNTTTINQVAAVELEPREQGKNADAGTQVQYQHTITNTGNGNDTFTLEAASELGYTVVPHAPSLPLEAGASAPITLTLTLPADASADEPDRTVVTVTSTIDSAVFVTATNVTTINPVDNITLAPNNVGHAYPGQTAAYTHTLINSGNRSNTISLEAVSSRGYPVAVHPANVTLARNESATITISTTIPAGASQGQEVTTVTAMPQHGDARTASNTTTIHHWQLFLPAAVKAAEWQTAGSGWPADVVSRSLAVCAGNPDFMIAGTIERGVWLRNGADWSKADTIPDGHSVTNAVLNEACDRAYVSLFDQGVWQGSRSGALWTWTQLGSAEVKEARALTLAGGILYVGGEFGIRYWQNGAWQTTDVTHNGSQPVMHLSSANPLTNAAPAYAVRWQNGTILRSTTSLGAWEELPLPALPDTLTRVAYGTGEGVQFVGTSNQTFRWHNNNWHPLGVSAGLRSAVVVGSRSYLGFAAGAGVYELSYEQLTPLTNGWTTPPEFVYELRLVGNKLHAATSTGVWVYSVP